MSDSTEPTRPTPRGPALLGAVVVIAVLCLIATALIATFILDDGAIPTRAATAVAGEAAATVDAGPTPTFAPQPGGRSAGDPYIPDLGNTGYDVQRYTIQLALTPADDRVEGMTTIDGRATLNGLVQLSLDFAGFEVTSVAVDGRASSFVRDGKKLVVDLPGALPAQTPFSLAVAYRGEPAVEPSPYIHFLDHLGLFYPEGETIFAVAEPDGARYWFPGNDHPRDKATFRFEIAVPAGLTAVANGQLLETRPAALPDGAAGTLYVWEHNYPMATYLATVAVGRYERLEGVSLAGIPLRHYTFPESRAALEPAAAVSAEAIDWMSDLFGPYPYEAFGFVIARVPGGSLETQTMVLLSDAMIGSRTAVHELAHQWFGNWVSLDSWSEMWRNEGFATYVTYLWLTRDNPAQLETEMALVRGAVDNNAKDYPLDYPPPEYLFEYDVYFEGALAVHALRQEVGDDAFFGGLRTYFERFGGGAASDEQFQAVMEEAAGRPLEAFFSQWFPAP